ncbi:MAG: hypothetical protein KF871_10540 [Hydrogenophaga sp.]|uniref:hypothetical protein n=1 Tax=Hydrogenophaga sp. TaxID=1904254 RepID=UPI001DB143EC|nr:hypothetical protein [Hydrogenophaga sp.]MBX3610319.1 hypothetical protein [Hydrogenophaga sp.]
MTADELETLCHRACLSLGLDDPHALGKGHTITHRGVHLEVQHLAPRAHFLLLAEIGLFEGQQRAQVHERLLSLQLGTADHPNLRFGFHPVRQTTLLCLTAVPPVAIDSAPTWLAGLMNKTADQVDTWRQELRHPVLSNPDSQWHAGRPLTPAAWA